MNSSLVHPCGPFSPRLRSAVGALVVLAVVALALPGCSASRQGVTTTFDAPQQPHATGAEVTVVVRSVTQSTSALVVDYAITNQRATAVDFKISRGTLLDFTATVAGKHVVAAAPPSAATVLSIPPHQEGVIVANFAFDPPLPSDHERWELDIRLITSLTDATVLKIQDPRPATIQSP